MTFDPERYYHVSDGSAADGCPHCKASFSDRCVDRMTQEQIDLLEADICPFCQRQLN